MTLKLSDEQRQALQTHPGQPLFVVDGELTYVIMPYDDSEPDPREFYPTFHEAVKEDVDAPGMEDYDDYEPPRSDS